MKPDRDSAHTLAHYQDLLVAARRRRDLDRFGLKEVMRVTNLNEQHPEDGVVVGLLERVAHVEARLERQDALLAQARAELGQLRIDLDQEIHHRRQRVMNLEHDRGGRGA